MKSVSIGIIGAGFWSFYQIAAWKELEGANVVAIANRTREKAQKIATKYNISHVYTDPKKMLQEERLDVVDVITDVSTHPEFVRLVAKHNIPVICQKPLAQSLQEARELTTYCHSKNVPFFVHENWRFQKPIRRVKELLDQNIIGKVFRARILYANNFPVFQNQPFLKDLKQFILTDIGTHILDVARFLFGEADTLYCQTASVTPSIKGEDVATCTINMKNNIHCIVEMSYASEFEYNDFPQTLIEIEGSLGSIILNRNYEIVLTTEGKTSRFFAQPTSYPWVEKAYELVQSSIVDTNKQFLSYFQNGTHIETTAEDNIKTLELVFSAYESAQNNTLIYL